MTPQPIPADVESYFDGLTPEKRAVVRSVFDAVRESMPEGYVLGMYWGMPGWVIPLETYPNTYNKQPLAYVSLAAQKNYNSLYLTGLYSDPEADAAFRAEWAATGRKLDMGKSCLRFKKLGDVDLGIVRRTVASVSVDQFLAIYERIQPRATVQVRTLAPATALPRQ